MKVTIKEAYEHHYHYPGKVLFSKDGGVTWQSVGMDTGKWNPDWNFAFIDQNPTMSKIDDTEKVVDALMSDTDSITIEFNGNEYTLNKTDMDRFRSWKEDAESKIPGMNEVKALLNCASVSKKHE